LITGTPNVFQTAPPHPWSKAFITWYPEFAGGADANQKGLGDLIPAKFDDRSGMLLGHFNGSLFPDTYYGGELDKESTIGIF
jgi:hypothetical protein